MGSQGVLISLATICFALGVINLLSPGRSYRRWSVVVLSVTSLVLVLIKIPPKMINLYAGKIAKATEAPSAQVLFVREGRAATVTVIDQSGPKGAYRDMFLNGVEEASTRYYHVQLFKLLGIFPLLLHETHQPKDCGDVASSRRARRGPGQHT